MWQEFVWTSTKNERNEQNTFPPSTTRNLITRSDHLSRESYAKHRVRIMSKSALTCDRCLSQSVTFGYYWCICVLNTLPKASQRWFPQHQFFPTNWEDLQVLPFMLLLSIKFTGLFALMRLDVAQPKNTLRKAQYSQLSPCWHPFITNTPIIWTAVKSYEKIY